ncbi:MAG: hypothetical protein ABIH47_08455, partial [Candidatus Omnitrophota bacterium]
DDPEKPMQSKVIVDYNAISKYIGNLPEKRIVDYRRGIRKDLAKLEKKYGLIKWDREHGEMPEIVLLDFNLFKKPLKIMKRESITIPKNYWENDTPRKLSHAGKFMYLLSLYETSISPIQPWWSMSQNDITKKYKVNRRTISGASKELKEQNILEINYARTARGQDGNFAMRAPNKYKLNDLISDKEKEQIYAELIKEYGKDNLIEAESMAAAIDEPNDPLVIETLLDLIQIYGIQKVKDAIAIPAEYKRDSSMKHIRYVIGILQKENKEPQDDMKGEQNE